MSDTTVPDTTNNPASDAPKVIEDAEEVKEDDVTKVAENIPVKVDEKSKVEELAEELNSASTEDQNNDERDSTEEESDLKDSSEEQNSKEQSEDAE